MSKTGGLGTPESKPGGGVEIGGVKVRRTAMREVAGKRGAVRASPVGGDT